MSPNHAVIGVFRRRSSADACYNAVLRRGYLASDISLMMSDRTRKHDYPREIEPELVHVDEFGGTVSVNDQGHPNGTPSGTKAMSGIGIGGSLGAIFGATLAAIAATGTSLVIPGVSLVIAGPLMAAFTGGGAGALAGGMAGALVGLGISEQDAHVYNKALQDGGVVMSIQSCSQDACAIKQLMIENSGEQVCCANC